MTTRDRKEVEAALERKGFTREETHHHFFIYWNSDGKKTPIRTRTSHSHKTLGDPLLSQMAKQIKLTNKKFLELVDCTLDQAGYEQEVDCK
ncbi:MAG: type II toxin-antitoxin system HicA family toxin [Rhodospirillaceae bacterium]|nr:type II toxin-antitoxin system HicA family toxin [Rhodospirillales bacterium]